MSKNKWRSICVIAIIMSLLLACSAIFINVQNPAFAQEEASYSVDNGKYDEYTDNRKKNGVDLLKYPSYYGAGTTFTTETIYENTAKDIIGYMHFSGDDKIVDFVPRELFTKVGKTFYIGKEYGFIVDTFEVEYSDALHSIVMLFYVQVEDNIIETKNHIKVKVQSVFQGEFCYFNNDAEIVATKSEANNLSYKKGHFGEPLELVNEGSQQNDYVVALPVYVFQPNGVVDQNSFQFQEVKKYYLSNVSGMMSLYNENHLNVGDAGYNAENDDGAFFSQADYAYNGHFYEGGDLSSAGSLAGTFFSIALDALGTVSPVGSVASSVINWISNGLTAKDVIVGIKELEGLSDKMVSTEKKLTYVPDYTTKDQQLLFNNCLNRDMVIAVESGDEKQLLLDSGDYVELDFQVSTTDTTWATRYILGLAIDAVPLSNEEEDVTLQSETVGYSGSVVFTENESFELTANAENYNYAFEDCSGLTSVTIGDSVMSIGDSDFI